MHLQNICTFAHFICDTNWIVLYKFFCDLHFPLNSTSWHAFHFHACEVSSLFSNSYRSTSWNFPAKACLTIHGWWIFRLFFVFFEWPDYSKQFCIHVCGHGCKYFYRIDTQNFNFLYQMALIRWWERIGCQLAYTYSPIWASSFSAHAVLFELLQHDLRVCHVWTPLADILKAGVELHRWKP